MNLKVITPINENLEQVVEIPFFPNDRFAVREYAREVQEIVQPVLPIVNPIIIAKNYDESDRIEYGRVGSVDNPKVILPNECQEFIADLDRLAPGYYYLNFYQGEDRHKTNFLYVFPGLHPSAIQIHRYFDGNMSYDLTGDFRDKKFSCVSEARAHNDLGRIHQNKLAFDRTNFIDEVLDLKVVVSMPVGENLERIIEIPIFPNEQNAVRDYNREALNIVPVPAPVIHIVEQAPVPVPAPVIHVIEQVLAPEPIIILPVRHGPNLSVMDKASVERIAQELNQDDAGRRWEAAEDIMRKAPACKRNYVELQRIQRTIINERDIVKFNNFNELLAYFDLRGPQYERICEKSLRERPQILDGRIAYPLSHPMGVTDYDYMISVASLLRHCEQRDLLSEDDVGLLKMIFTGYFDDQIGRCSTGLFIRMFLVHMEILKKFYAN